MKTTWHGEQKIIVALNRQFAFTDESHNAVVQAEWANKILSEPATIYPNGKHSHEVAGETLDKAEDVLIEYQLF